MLLLTMASDLSENSEAFLLKYISDYFKNRSENEKVSEVVNSDIERIKKKIHDGIIKWGSEDDLFTIYNDILSLNHQIKLLQSEIQEFVDSDLLDQLKRVASKEKTKAIQIEEEKPTTNDNPLPQLSNFCDSLINLYLKPSLGDQIEKEHQSEEEVEEVEEREVKSRSLNDFYSQDFLLRAKQLICEDLHNVVGVGSPDEESDFPACQVSSSVIKLINLFDEISLKASENVELSQLLYETIDNAIELFVDMAPIKHKKLITKVPQQAAVFYNNCMYLAHSIKHLKENFNNQISSIDFVAVLRQFGDEVLHKHMQLQELVILGFLQEPSVLQFLIENANENNKQTNNPFEVAIKRCLTHFRLLKTTFEAVLPPVVYDRTIGTLLNTFFNEIIQKITIIDDISADVAIQFVRDFELISKEVPQLFISSNVSSSISKWNKFCELKFLLNANLIEIVDRWSSGCGPLAAEFTSEEVRRLIRALFQNTDKRALALSKIKNYQ